MRSSPGQPIEPAIRSAFEQRLGFDFGKVRLHTDARAAESARALQARAYTIGHDIVLGAGRYSPGSAAGQRLLAHELVHVAQQSGAAHGQPTTAQRTHAEAEARDVAARVGEGAPATVVGRFPQHIALDGDDAPAGAVTIVISLGSNQIEIRSPRGNHRYALTQTGLQAGSYTVSVAVNGNRVQLTGQNLGAAASGRWSWRIRRDQENPSTLLRGVSSATIQIIDEPLPEIANTPPTPSAPTPQDPNALVLTPEEARRRCEAGDLPVMTFPLRFTRWNESYVIATREGDRIRVRMPMSSWVNGRALPGMRRMPPINVVTGILLEPNQLVRVRYYSPRLNPFADDEVTEVCRTGEEMLGVSAQGDNAVMMNIALTGVDALMFTPVGAAVGRGISAAAGTVTRRVITPGLAAAMIGTARVAEPALIGGSSRAAVTVVEQRAAAAAVETVGSRAIAQTGIQGVERTVVEAGARASLDTAANRGMGAGLRTSVSAWAAPRGAGLAGAETTRVATAPSLARGTTATPRGLGEASSSVAREGAVELTGSPLAEAPIALRGEQHALRLFETEQGPQWFVCSWCTPVSTVLQRLRATPGLSDTVSNRLVEMGSQVGRLRANRDVNTMRTLLNALSEADQLVPRGVLGQGVARGGPASTVLTATAEQIEARAAELEAQYYEQLWAARRQFFRGSESRDLLQRELRGEARARALVQAQAELRGAPLGLQPGASARLEIDAAVHFPMGFYDRQGFEQFSRRLYQPLRSVDGSAELVMEGSGVTGRRFDRLVNNTHTGAPFNVGRVSDYDVGILSRDLYAQARRLGIPVVAGPPPRTQPLTRANLVDLRLTALDAEATAAVREATGLSHTVNFKIYENSVAATTRLPLPRPLEQ